MFKGTGPGSRLYDASRRCRHACRTSRMMRPFAYRRSSWIVLTFLARIRRSTGAEYRLCLESFERTVRIDLDVRIFTSAWYAR